ncbi:MAG: DUF3834 domain-containing protein [Thermoplasmataceae archaeon]
MEKINVIAAPGPVCYPLIAARDERFNIMFQKDGDAPVILDSSVSMAKRGISPNVSLIRGLAVASPDLGKKIGIMRRGSSNEILVRAIMRLKQEEAEIVTLEDASSIEKMMADGAIDSAVIPAPFGRGKPLESILESHGISTPGSCVAKVDASAKEAFVQAYRHGIEKMREDPEGTAKYIAAVLPNKTDPGFIMKAILETDTSVRETGEHRAFEELVRRFS